MAHKIENKTYFYVFLVVVFALGAVILWPLRDILLVSGVISILFRPVYVYFAEKLKLPKVIATLISVLLVLVTVLLPLWIFINISVAQFQVFYHDVNIFLEGKGGIYDVIVSSFDRINLMLARIPFVEYRLSVDNVKLIIEHNLTPMANAILSYSLDLGVSVAKNIPLLIVFLYLVWYSFPEYDRMLNVVRRLSPLSESLDNLYIDRITATIRGIAKGMFTIALVQASIGALTLWICGVPYVFFWFITMVIVSILPLGTSFLTVPISIVLLLLGDYWQAALILLVQFVVTSNIDNILRPMLIPKEVELHPALLLLSFIGGIQVFGVMGLLYGPLIMVVMMTTFEIYQKYYKEQ